MPITLSRLLSPLIVGVFLGSSYFALGMFVPQYREFQEDSESLLAGSAARAATEGGVWRWGGFMNHREIGSEKIPDHSPYYSQFGLHFKLMAWANQVFPNRPEMVHLGFRLAAALLIGFVFAWFVHAVHHELGSLAALTVLFFLASSSPLIAFATKVYWLEALLFLPFVYSFARYERLRAAGRLNRFYCTIGLLIFVKSLCGYEYLSNILLSAMTPLLYHELAAGSTFRLITRRMAITFAAGVAGFAVAYGMTFVQAYWHLGSAEQAIRSVLHSAGYNTLGDHHGRQVPLFRTLARYFQYFLFEGQAQIIIFTAGAFAVYWALVSSRTINENRHDDGIDSAPSSVRNWGLTLIFALLASLSWNSLAHGHMRGHIQINFITFYIPFNLMAYAFLGMLVQSAMNGRRI